MYFLYNNIMVTQYDILFQSQNGLSLCLTIPTYSKKCETFLFFAGQSQTNTSWLPSRVNTCDHGDPIVTSGESWRGRRFFFSTITSGPAKVSSCVAIGSRHAAGQRLRPFTARWNFIILLRLGILSKTHILDGHVLV